ncbi:hypothetical protein [Haloquadratum walsbyi]|uniref:Uncharacterized protein n=1 Tax=Haloquadratum walsbyi J07HQW2 TaxID=1238425 RepID=U1NAA9_9EURY|nr:hypothetical protein [Haloquadratum walsbyi]ERG93765.1 MAG: hypothetical protein J07HQW2_00199 [Haloquadratum walsbyi J07HQW2]
MFACGNKQFLAYGLESEPNEPNWDVQIDEGYTQDVATDGDMVWFSDYTWDRTGEYDETFETFTGTLYAYSKSGTQKWSVTRRFGGAGQIVEYDGTLYETTERWRR